MDEESRSRKHEYWNLVVVLVPEGARDDVLGEVEALMAPYEGEGYGRYHGPQSQLTLYG